MTTAKADPLVIQVEATDPQILDEAVRTLWRTVAGLEAVVDGPWPRPTRVDRYRILRGEAARTIRREVQIRTHRRTLVLPEPAPATISALTELDLPAGVDIRVEA